MRGKKKMTGRKRKALRPEGLSRRELAVDLGVGLTTIDRLIASGLRSLGRRGRARVYDELHARELCQRVAPDEMADAEMLMRDYRTHSLDLDDRRRALEETWVSDSAWLPLWRRVVSVVSRVTAAAVPGLARIVGESTLRETQRFDTPPGAPRQLPRRLITAPEVLAILDGRRSARPWPEGAETALRALAEQGQGIWLYDHGGWTPERHLPPPRSEEDLRPIPFIDPFLERVQSAVAPAFDPLAATLASTDAPAPRPEPSGVDEARRQWREARSSYREQRVAIRRGHRRRADVVRSIEMAIRTHTVRWVRWGSSARGHAGDEMAARTSAERWRETALRDLATLGGIVPLVIAKRPRR